MSLAKIAARWPELAARPGLAELHRTVQERARLAGRPILYLEFGVGHGGTLSMWGGAADLVVGVDSFRGLPEAWGHMPAGSFARDPREAAQEDTPLIVGRLECGMVQRAVSLIAEGWAGLRVVHFDVDLYVSTLAALGIVRGALRPGDLLIFDELGIVPEHEQRALLEWLDADPSIRLRAILACSQAQRVVFEVEAS